MVRLLIIKKIDNEVDILLATYETIAAEFKADRKDSKGRKLNTIHDIEFHRIVLDEAQTIRNGKSKVFKAIMSVAEKSDFSLALTGSKCSSLLLTPFKLVQYSLLTLNGQ